MLVTIASIIPCPLPFPARNIAKFFLSALAQLKKFEPELVGVSAGFDAYARDPLAQETLEAEDFYWLGKQIRALNLPAYNVLEGGYSRDLPELVFSYLKGLEGK